MAALPLSRKGGGTFFGFIVDAAGGDVQTLGGGRPNGAEMTNEATFWNLPAARPAFRIHCDRKRLSLEALTERLAAATGEAQVVSALLSYLEGKFDRGAFLGLKPGAEQRREVIGAGTKGCVFNGPFALEGAPQLQRVVRDGRPFIGKLRADEGEVRLGEALGRSASCPAALVPLTVAGQVVAVLCAIDLQERLLEEASELRRVAAAASLAFEMLCIGKKIRSG